MDCAYKLLKKHVGIEKYTLLDTACGNKEFLKLQHPKKIGADIDPKCDALIINALVNPKRENYGVSQDEPLIIVGNPPYNDRTSFAKQPRFGDKFFKIFCNFKAGVYLRATPFILSHQRS